MSVYQKIASVGKRFIPQHTLFKVGFNLSPMYRRSTGRVTHVSPDLKEVTIRLKRSWKNKNYVNSIFGGSLFSAVDPIPMVQLINLIGEDYVVWDKGASIAFKKPAKETLYASFVFTKDELKEITDLVSNSNEIEITKTTKLTNQDKTVTFCEVEKTLYIADKSFYKEKRKRKRGNN